MKQKEHEQLEAMYGHYHWRCFLHGNPATQRAHLIGDTKLNRRVYGNSVIDNPLNWLPACSLGCNKRCDVGFIPMAQKKVADIIESNFSISEKRDLIESLINGRNNV